jgi:proteic killer suppression protein
MIRSLRHKGLQRYWTRSDASGLRPDWINKIGIMLDALDAAQAPEDMAMIGAGFHPLKGNLKGRYALNVSRNWRLTFGWDGKDAIEVDLEDYHG